MKRNRNNSKTTTRGGVRIWKKEAYELYQELCDRVFGKDAVMITPAPANNVTGLLRYADDVRVPGYTGLHELRDPEGLRVQVFKRKLEERLTRLRERTAATPEYYKLLQTVAQVAHPIEGELAYAKLAVWDLLIYEVTGYLENGIDSLAIVLLEDEELDADHLRPILWAYNPYQMAEQSRDLVRKKFEKDITQKGVKIAVLVRVPWVSAENLYFEGADYVYFRTLARRTFMDNSSSRIGELENFVSKEKFIKKLGGIIVIDEGWVKGETYCHAFKNPNSEWKDDEELMFTLLDAPDEGDKPGVYEDFKYDTY